MTSASTENRNGHYDQPPQNLEAERSVLGAILLDPSKLDEVKPVVRSSDFYRDAHEIVFRVMCQLQDRGAPVEVVSVAEALGEKLQAIGGDDFLAELAGSVPHAANAVYHAGIVAEKSRMRGVIELGERITRLAYAQQCTAGELAQKATAELETIASSTCTVSASSVVHSEYSTLELSDFGNRLSEVEEEPVVWLADQRLAAGKMHLTIGPGGVGKSTFELSKAAALTVCGTYPGGPKFHRAGNVAVLAAEDGEADTIKPRFVAAGGDQSKIMVLRTQVTTKDRLGKVIILPAVFQDLEYWRRFFDLWNPLLLIADPVQAFLGKGVRDKGNSEVRNILEPFAELLRQRGVAFVAITHTPKKIESKNAAESAIDSVAYPNLSRVVNVHWIDPDDPDHYLITNPKNNLGRRQPTIGYRIEGHQYSSGGATIETSRIICDDVAPEVHPGEVLNGDTRARASRLGIDLNSAAEWLKARLANGPISSIVCSMEGDQQFGVQWPEGDTEDARIKRQARVKWWRESILKPRLNGKTRKLGYQGAWFFTVPENPWPPSKHDIEVANAIEALISADSHSPSDSLDSLAKPQENPIEAITSY